MKPKTVHLTDLLLKMSQMGYNAGFTVISGYRDTDIADVFIPGLINNDESLLISDEGNELMWCTDDTEVLHLEYAYYTFGSGEVCFATHEDLIWLENNWAQAQVVAEPVECGRFRVLNPYFKWEDEEEDED